MILPRQQHLTPSTAPSLRKHSPPGTTPSRFPSSSFLLSPIIQMLISSPDLCLPDSSLLLSISTAGTPPTSCVYKGTRSSLHSCKWQLFSSNSLNEQHMTDEQPMTPLPYHSFNLSAMPISSGYYSSQHLLCVCLTKTPSLLSWILATNLLTDLSASALTTSPLLTV